jgi:hypothetical protein
LKPSKEKSADHAPRHRQDHHQRTSNDSKQDSAAHEHPMKGRQNRKAQRRSHDQENPSASSHSRQDHPKWDDKPNTNRRDSNHNDEPTFSDHVTSTSIFFLQDILNAENSNSFETLMEAYRTHKQVDPFMVECSAVKYLQSKSGPSQQLQGHMDSMLRVLQDQLSNCIEEYANKPSDAETKSRLLFDGEKIDTALLLIEPHLFAQASGLVKLVVKFIDAGGRFEPQVWTSTWRKIWISTALLVLQGNFIQQKYASLCENAVALFNTIYLHQSDYIRSFNRQKVKATLVSPASSATGPSTIPASEVEMGTTFKSILELEFAEMEFTKDDAALLTGSQVVSAMLSILSGVGGHSALRKAIVTAYANIVAKPHRFPPRRLVPLAALLFSWGFDDVASDSIISLSRASNTSLYDPKTALAELKSLEFLMISNCPAAILKLTTLMLDVPHHVPSPLILSQLVWAMRETQEYSTIMHWWRTAAARWNHIRQASGGSSQLVVRPGMDSVMSLLDIATEHLALEDLQAITDDMIRIFDIYPAGSRSRLLIKLARSGRIEEAIRALGETESKAEIYKDQGNKAPSPYLMTANLIIALAKHSDFNAHIERLIEASIKSAYRSYDLGSLLNYTVALIPEPAGREDALIWAPFLNWVVSLPASADTPSTVSGLGASTIRFMSNEEHRDHVNVEPIVRFSARTYARLAEIAGLVGLPDVVSNIIWRVNTHYTQEKGTTMPISPVWIKPLVRAHAFTGNFNVVLQLLGSLKETFLITDREIVWKLAFKAFIQSGHVDSAVQLFLAVKNGTIDDKIPTWSGGYTMGIQALLSKGEPEKALQLYTLMTSDDFELRDRSIVLQLIAYLNTLSLEQPNSYTEAHDTALRRLSLLEPTLDDSPPDQRKSPVYGQRRRQAKARNRRDKLFLADLDRKITGYKPRFVQDEEL